MQKTRITYAVAIAAVGVLGVAGVAGVATAHDRGSSSSNERLTGFEEVPALSTPGAGDFRAYLNRSGDTLRYRLRFDNLESQATQAHIHFENRTNNGPVVAFLCSNLGNGPAGTQACPADGGSISGSIAAADVLGGGAAQGLAAGELEELLNAIDAGATYVNVHTTGRPGGEIRAQLEDH
jgi:hypothetical protein